MQPTRTSAEIAARADLSDEARALVTSCPAAEAWIDALTQRGLYADALAAAYHRLPAREAAWWATLCLWHAAQSAPKPPETAAIRAIVRWVQEPTPERLQAVAAAAGPTGGAASPAGRLTLASASADPAQAGTLAVSALLLASARAEPLDPDRPRRAFLELAHDVANRRNLWE